MGWDVADDALFNAGPPLSRCWAEPWRHAFFLRVDARLGGFAILDERSHLNGDPTVMDVGEFFMLRKYRRQGIASKCAAYAFDLFPRRWEVREVAKNVAVIAFWRKTIASYTRRRFVETMLDDERWRGPVQSFDARDR